MEDKVGVSAEEKIENICGGQRRLIVEDKVEDVRGE